jgi:hypothetical protein
MRHGDDKRDTISMTGSRPSENSLKRRAVSASINAALENRDTQHGSTMSRGSITQTRNIYVQAFPPTGAGGYPISTDGGSDPWSADGKTLFYLDRNSTTFFFL